MHDVIIIGAGPAGLSTAFWCDELGLDTLVLEQAEQSAGNFTAFTTRSKTTWA
jgi:flavin-dependent dehydrogenase